MREQPTALSHRAFARSSLVSPYGAVISTYLKPNALALAIRSVVFENSLNIIDTFAANFNDAMSVYSNNGNLKYYSIEHKSMSKVNEQTPDKKESLSTHLRS